MEQNNNTTTERVRILFEGASANNSAGIAAAVLFTFIYSGQIDFPVLLAWIGFMLIVAMFRYKIIFDFKKNALKTSDYEKFENRYAYTTGLFGVGCAFLVASGLSLPAEKFHLYSLLLLMAAIAVAIPLYHSSIKSLYFFVAPMLVTSVPLLLYRGGEDAALGAAIAIFGVLVIRASRNLNSTLIDTFTSRNQAEELAESLKQLQHEKSSTDQRMQGIMDHAPAVIYIKDIDGHFSFINKQFEKLFHIQRDEIIGKTLYDIFPKEIADHMRLNDIEVLKANKPLEYEESAPQEDGLHHYISIKFPLFDEAGNISAVGGISTDITERFNIEESLRISQQRLLLHREQSPVGVIEWNTDFEFLDWNPAAEKIFGFTKNEVAGKHITKRILPESARPAVNKVWEDLLANKGGVYSLNENTTKDGRTILCEWHNTPLVDHDGRVIGVTSLVDDVTERQRNEETLRHSQKMDAIGKLTGGVAHDFNNMLGVILGYSQLLKQRVGDEDPKQSKYCDQIINAGERAKKLTSKLLEFSRKSPSSAGATHINKLLHDMQHMLEKTLTARINMVMELEDDLWPVWLDKARLEDAILNMCINSMHAMASGGTLTLSACNKNLADSDINSSDITPGGYVLLSVIDTGIGMTEEVQQKMFDPFFSTKAEGGTGLGLSQVYGFVQQSGGSIQVFSEPGKGTRIELYIPKYQESEAPKPEMNTVDSVELPSGRETILVVDDEIALLDLTEEILTDSGYNVFRAEGAEQALEILDNKSVDLLLSDVIMPGVDGYQLATEVEKRFPKIKIQMVSGYSAEHKINLANETLHQQRLHKPTSAEDLLVRIRSLLDEGK